MKEVNFLFSNFGNYIGPQDPVNLKQLTIISGRNGQGKSILLDAIKSLIILDKRLLKKSFNPKSSKRAKSIDEYIETFTIADKNSEIKLERYGPTILAFHYHNEIDTYLFGEIWERPYEDAKFFVKSRISLDQSIELVRESRSRVSFLSRLNDIVEGTYKEYDSIRAYCSDLHKRNLLFYFPKGIGSDKEFRFYLSILNESVLSLAGNIEIDEEALQKQMYWPEEPHEVLVKKVSDLEQAIRNYNDYSEKLKNEDNKLDKLLQFKDSYKKFYFEIYFKNKMAKIIMNELYIDKNRNDIDSKKKEVKEIEEKTKRNNTSLERIVKDLHEQTEKKDKDEDLLSRLSQLIPMKEVHPSMYDELERKIIKNNKDRKRMEFIKQEIKRFNTTIRDNEREIDRIKVEKKEVQASLERFTTRLKILEEYIDKQYRMQKKLTEKVILTKERKKTIENLEIEIKNDQNYLSTELNEQISHKNIKNQLNNLKERNKDILDEINNIKIKIDNLSTKEEEKDAITHIKKKFGLKQLYEYFDNVNLNEASLKESKYKKFSKFLVIKDKELFNEILAEARELDFNISAIILPEDTRIEDFGEDYRKDGFTISTFFNHIVTQNKIITSFLFGRKSRISIIEKMKKEIGSKRSYSDSLEGFIEILYKLETRFEQIESIYAEYPKLLVNIREEHIRNIEEELKKQEDHIMRKNEEKDNLGKNIQKMSEELTRLDSEKSSLIERNKESENSVKRNAEERDTLSNDVTQIEEEIKNLEKFVSKYETMLLKLNKIHNTSLNFKDNISKLDNLHEKTNSQYQKVKEKIEILQEDQNRKSKENNEYSERKERLLFEISAIEKENEDLNEERNSISHEMTKIWERKIKEYFSSMLLDEYMKETRSELKYKDNDELTELIESLSEKHNNKLIRIHTDIVNLMSEFGFPTVSVLDFNNLLDLTELFNTIQVDPANINLEKIFTEKKIEIKKDMKRVLSDFSNHLSFILKSVINSINNAVKNTKKYNEVGALSRFGEIDKVEFRVEKKLEFKRLNTLYNNIISRDNKEVLQELMERISRTEKQSILSYYAKNIFKDARVNPNRILDFHEYFYLNIRIFKNGIKQKRLRTSGGEGLGVKFLIYGCIFNMLRRFNKLGIFNKGDIFIFFDEYGAIDEKTLSSLSEISKNLKINAIFVGTDLPGIIPEDAIGYVVEKGILKSLSPQKTLEIVKEG